MDYRDYNDFELIYYVRDKDEEAANIIFKKYEPLIMLNAGKMYPYCKYNGIEINDLIQEGMLGLNMAINGFDEKSDNLFYTFAKKCIERKMISLVIKSRRQKHKILNESLSLDFTLEDDKVGSLNSILKDSSLNPEEMVIDLDSEELLLKEIKSVLTDKEETVFELKVAGFDYKEIAEILDVSPKAVDNAIQRIKNKCKEIIKID